MPICLWLNYSKLFKSITRMTQMSLFTHLDSFLPINTPATVQNHLFWKHGQSASPCGASTHFFYSQSLRSTPRGPSGPAPSTISWATRRLSQLSLLLLPCACLHGDPIHNNCIYRIFTYCAKYFTCIHAFVLFRILYYSSLYRRNKLWEIKPFTQ